MSIAKTLLPEYDHEMSNTRRYLANMPEGKNDWKPHAKSMSLQMLACHLAELPGWVASTLAETELDLAPPDGEPYQTEMLATREELLEAFDRDVAAGRKALEATEDAALMVEWTLLQGGHKIMSMPRVAVLRGFIMNHMIHHRGQLGVYFRLLDVPVPAVYGPSADES
ncbi:MAG: DinB family protein [Acidobacteriota bacterium]